MFLFGFCLVQNTQEELAWIQTTGSANAFLCSSVRLAASTTVSVQRWASSSPAWLLITFLNIQVLKEQILIKKKMWSPNGGKWVIPALERLWQEDGKFEASLDYRIRKTISKQNKKWFKAIPSYTEFKINLTYTDMHKLFFNF